MTTLAEKWKPILEHEDYSPIKGSYNKRVIAQLLENTADFQKTESAVNRSYGLLGEASPTNSMGLSSSDASTGAIDTFDPVLVSLVRRAWPNLIANDIAGVQPMSGPTGLIFALRARYDSQTGSEAFYYEANTGFSARGGANATANSLNGYASNTVVGGGANNVGANSTWTIPGVSNNAGNSTYNFAGGMSTALAEGLGGNSTAIFPEMSFSIEKVSVTAKERALKAEYSVELAQDIKKVHGLDAESLLSELLTTEILAEINRELLRTINVCAVPGSQTGTTTAGIFDLDTDSNGRWSVEKFKGLMFHLEREANLIAKQTRRGRGNIIICSADVASALEAAGKLSYTPNLDGNNLNVDDTGNPFVGILNGKYKVYIDPYAIGGNYMTIGYRGPSPLDAGVFYCPYVPLQMLRAQDPNTFQPKIAYKTRYGMVANPFAEGATAGVGALNQDSNVYYRRTLISNIM